MKNPVKRLLPQRVLSTYRLIRTTLGAHYEAIIDREANRICGKNWLPPITLRRLVGELSDFDSIGATQVVCLQLLCSLRPNERVLDIGCGCGRVAFRLIPHIKPPGRYVGMDIHRPTISWCQQHITTSQPHFSFFHADLRNAFYNPQGQFSAARYIFPFDDSSFDVIHLRSVFTHMKPDETRNYLKEIARLLAPRGRCLATFFLFNDGQDDSFFGFGNDTYRWRNGQVPEEVCGYAEKYVEDLLAQSGLRLRYAPFYGGRPGSLSGQDILVMEHASEGYE